MKNMKKKGFTLVELLVVIAIIAVLATVSVVGYTVFINRANMSADQTTIEMLNDNLDASFVTGKPDTASEAITALRPLGVFGDKFSAYSKGFHYVYDLDNNQFVLFDNNDNCVYPENAKVSDNLWALYADQPENKVDGITKYVAITGISNTTALSHIFGTEGTFTFDLNSYVLRNNIHAGVTVLNGIVTSNVADVIVGDGAAKKETATFSATTTEYTDKVIKLNADASSAIKNGTTFTNCVIELTTKDSPASVQGGNVVFDGCTFVGSTKWALEVKAGSAEIKNCTFVNCGRGINVFTTAENVVIENNRFELADGEKANAIQIASVGAENYPSHLTHPGYYNANFSLTVKNNEFISANSVVVVHEIMTKALEVTTAETIMDAITFSGNTYGNIYSTKVLVDPDADSTEASTLATLVNGLTAKVK